jgi:sugar/nucleoside kinase (ribokinase family)
MSVTVIGDAFVDIIVPAQGIKPGETRHRNILTLCGGTANVAVQVSKLGEKSRFVGKIGNDLFGEYFKQNLRINEVKDLIFVDDEKPTGLCVSMTYGGGERAMVANRGANDYLKAEEVKKCINEIANSKIVYFSGYSLFSKENVESVLYALEECYKQNCKIYFNPGAPNLINEQFKQIINDFVDVLILNIEEARNMTKQNKLEEIAKSLNEMVDTAVITMGEGGCVVSKGNEYFQIEPEKLNVSDTTGAGDAFAAGFVLGRLQNMDEVECATLGNKTAANFLREKMEFLR